MNTNTLPSLNDAGLSDGVAIVTGGSRGIGRAIVETLAGSGMEVVFTYRENSEAAAEVVGTGGAKITSEKIDVRDANACSSLAEKTFDRTGRIDLLVNNAGINRDSLLADMSCEDLR